jgi:drug/metabolite transporter (DMT)-like permease
MIGEYLLSGGIDSINFGDILTFFCAILYALHVVLVTEFSKKSPEKDLLTSQFLMVALLNSLFGLNQSWKIDVKIFSVALFTAIFATIYALIAQAKYQKVVGSNTSALIFVGEPVFATIFSIILLSERLDMLQIFGVVLTMFALILSIIPEKYFRNFFRHVEK